jgi:hypothetical protein
MTSARPARFHDEDDFRYRMQFDELGYVASSRAVATSLAKNYVGPPIEPDPQNEVSASKLAE